MVGLVDYTQQIGHSSGPGVVAEVEASHAARSVLRSNDYDHGAYSVGFGGYNNGIAVANGTFVVAGLQWISTRNFALIKKITGVLNTPFTTISAGVNRLYVSRASSYTQQFNILASDSTNMSPIPALSAVTIGAGNKHRTTMLNSDASGLVAASANAFATNSGSMVPGPSLVYIGAGVASQPYLPVLTGGKYTLDALPLGAVVTSTPVSAPANLRPLFWQTLFDAENIGPPLILENYTGLIFTIDVSSVGTGGLFSYAINIQWDEVFTYPLGANT